MRIQFIASALLSAILTAVVPACAMDAADDGVETTTSNEDLQSWKTDDQPATWGNPSAGEIPNASLTNDAVTQANNCSIVVWCNAPGVNGTVCRQLGCTLPQTLNECNADARAICGTLHYPLVIILLDGQVQPQPTPPPHAR